MTQTAARRLLQRPLDAAPQETKFLPSPPRLAVTATGEFEGYASLFEIPDLGRDVVLPGAFRDSLARRGAAGIRMLWQHDPAEPLGRWLSLAEDRRGLQVRGRLNLGVRRARDIAALMSEGAVDGLSIGYRVVEARRDRASGTRRLHRLDLWEISVVTFPMHPGARVTARAAAPPRDPVALAIGRATARLHFTPPTRTP
jgi:HK97 family phage prohead protease